MGVYFTELASTHPIAVVLGKRSRGLGCDNSDHARQSFTNAGSHEGGRLAQVAHPKIDS